MFNPVEQLKIIDLTVEESIDSERFNKKRFTVKKLLNYIMYG